MNTHRPPRGQLCIWTDVDPAHELDFNRWYDREHMQERVAIPGFQSARRFQAIGSCPRPYLALYYTDDIAVFRSDAYRNAFANQTQWSLRNFERMRGTQRRVGELALELGQAGGEGGSLAAFVVPEGRVALERLREALAKVAGADHVIRASMLRTDPALSAPVTPNTPPVPADWMVTIEATQSEVAFDQASALAKSLELAPGGVYAFRLLWRLGA
ncbi:hypothetical protein M6I34_13970 [Burkholderiaceae bacterium FT117]|uniref:DUF4286 family protein n=1 Tax=Zeimonas sediminis TaxID=2944268 RepID=UPI002342E5D1|nr:DUF4286 family protein [Zeimonas sediminis]MCM5571624.1 hypothetical protein [Zeimonas sediminis]